jgi:sulfite oxidase
MPYFQQITRRRFLQIASALAASCGLSRQARAAETSDLIARQADPYNAEPALAKLIAEGTTPVQHFYVRSHGPVQKVDAAAFRLHVEGLVNKPAEFTLDEIRGRFGSQTSEATLTCAGNRRLEMNRIMPVPGVQWDAGAIGHARWSGAALADVLRAAELQDSAKHVWFEGLDPIKEKDGSVAPFGGSIPLDKALAADVKVLLASAMNDEPLTAEHGFPLRAVVPGFIGARSVKWLTKIVVSDRPSPNHYVAEAYKLVQTDAKDELAAAEPIYAWPVNAAICTPGPADKLKAGRTTIAGYALAAGEPGCSVAKVELSTDGGKTWSGARLLGESRSYSWRLWTTMADLAAGRHELIVRASDSRANAMPQQAAWNLKGYLYNGWHRVNVDVA